MSIVHKFDGIRVDLEQLSPTELYNLEGFVMRRQNETVAELAHLASYKALLASQAERPVETPVNAL